VVLEIDVEWIHHHPGKEMESNTWDHRFTMIIKICTSRSTEKKVKAFKIAPHNLQMAVKGEIKAHGSCREGEVQTKNSLAARGSRRRDNGKKSDNLHREKRMRTAAARARESRRRGWRWRWRREWRGAALRRPAKCCIGEIWPATPSRIWEGRRDLHGRENKQVNETERPALEISMIFYNITLNRGGNTWRPFKQVRKI
jgi:hypothetical protein